MYKYEKAEVSKAEHLLTCPLSFLEGRYSQPDLHISEQFLLNRSTSCYSSGLQCTLEHSVGAC